MKEYIILFTLYDDHDDEEYLMIKLSFGKVLLWFLRMACRFKWMVISEHYDWEG